MQKWMLLMVAVAISFQITTAAGTEATRMDMAAELSRYSDKDAAFLQTVFSDEELHLYNRLQDEAREQQEQHNFEKASKLYGTAMSFYLQQLAKPYSKFASYTKLGETIQKRYNTRNTQKSFLDSEIERVKSVDHAFMDFTENLETPSLSDSDKVEPKLQADVDNDDGTGSNVNEE